MGEERYIEAHVHMDAWDAPTKRYVRTSGVEQFWVMDTRHPELNAFHVDQATLIRARREMPDRIFPFARVRWDDDERQVEEYFRAGFVGLKAIIPPKPYSDPAYLPIYEQAERLSMPVLFHTGIISHSRETERTPALRRLRGYGPAMMEPAFLATIADLFPNLAIIGGHMGFPYTEQAEHNLYYYPNIYHDISGYTALEWLMSVLGKRACGYLGGPQFFHEKLLFATDHCVGNRGSERWGVEKREAWRLFFRHLAYTHSWAGQTEGIFYRNAKRLMDGALERQEKIRAAQRGPKPKPAAARRANKGRR